MKKKVIVACGGAVSTSTIAANKVVELCKKNGIDVEICQIRISEIESNLSGGSSDRAYLQGKERLRNPGDHRNALYIRSRCGEDRGSDPEGAAGRVK